MSKIRVVTYGVRMAAISSVIPLTVESARRELSRHATAVEHQIPKLGSCLCTREQE